MLQKGKVNFLQDFYYGSSAKGQTITALADKHRPEALIANHSTSASHTIVEGENEFVFKALPTASFLNKVRPEYNPKVFMTAETGFEIYQLQKEIEYCGLSKEQVIIHPRAVVITQAHKDAEAGENGTLHLGSTMSGQGYAFAEKMTRQKGAKLAKDYPELREIATVVEDTDYYPFILAEILDAGGTALYELPQGFPLSLNHGPQFPFSTFRDITPDNAMNAIGLNSRDYLGSVVANIRALPIRVSNRYKGNTMEHVTLELADGRTVKPEELGMIYSDVNAITYDVNFKKEPKKFDNNTVTWVNGVVGSSGPFENDMEELSWRDLNSQLAKLGGNKDLTELTTLTRLVRRIARPKNGWSISRDMARKAKTTLGCTHVAYTFLNYIDPNVEGSTSEQELIKSELVGKWLNQAKEDVKAIFGRDLPVCALQAGKELKNVILLNQ